MRLLLAILAASAITCAPTLPRPRSPAPSHPQTSLAAAVPALRRVYVTIDHSTLDRSLDARIVEGFAPLRAAGYAFQLAADGEPYQIRVTRRHVLSCEGVYVGYWDRATRTVSIAPECLQRRAQLVYTIAHELGHSIGLFHVCRYPSEVIERRRVGDDCHGTAFGPALMNPYYEYGSDPSPSELTRLDLMELQRVGAIR